MNKKGIYLLAVIFLTLSFTACEEDLLNDDFRDELTGSWSVTENNNIKKSIMHYTVTISKSLSDTSVIRIANFYDVSGTVEAEISDMNVSIPQQTVAGFTFNGYGTISGNLKEINWSYTVDHNNGFVDQVTATYKKN